MEQTLIFIKPDVFERDLQTEVKAEIENFIKENDFVIVNEFNGNLLNKFLRYHYAVHLDKKFYEQLISDMSNLPFYAFVLEGENAVELVRSELQPTVREKFQKNSIENSLHASDSCQTAKYEIDNYLSFYK